MEVEEKVRKTRRMWSQGEKKVKDTNNFPYFEKKLSLSFTTFQSLTVCGFRRDLQNEEEMRGHEEFVASIRKRSLSFGWWPAHLSQGG